jgi:hypothetical protein
VGSFASLRMTAIFPSRPLRMTAKVDLIWTAVH